MEDGGQETEKRTLDSSTRKPGLRLDDPETCGEDPSANLRLMFRLAPVHCGRCKSYHLRHAARRVVMGRNGLHEDKAKLVDLIRDLIAQIPDGGTDKIHVVIAGSADTGVLATCAHAALTMGANIQARMHFTVIDICETPLQLCRAFATQHSLSLETFRADLTQPGTNVRADIVVLHSLLSYLPSERHVTSLELMRNWLKPGGAMLISNRLGGEPSAKAERRKRLAEVFIEEHLDEEISSSMPLDELSDLLSQSDITLHEFRDASEIASVVARAGLSITSEFVIERPTQSDSRIGAVRISAKRSHVVVATPTNS